MNYTKLMTLKALLLILILPLTNCCYSQVDTNYYSTGEVQQVYVQSGDSLRHVFFHKNGVISEEGLVVNGQKVGEWRRYYYSGELSTLFTYFEGVKEYVHRSFYKDGKSKSHGSVKNFRDYEYVSYYNSGIVQYTIEPTDSNTQIRKEFYPSGALRMEGMFAPIHGVWKTYYETGELKRLEQFEHGRMTGVWKEFYRNQDVKHIETCVPGTKIRDIKEYHPNGALKSIGRKNFQFSKTGYVIGEWKEYHDNGRLFKTSKYENAQKVGVWKSYHRNGTLASIGEYIEGIPIGEWKEYHKNGALKHIGRYAKNQYRMEKQGTWKSYYKNGVLKRTSFHEYRGVSGEVREYYRSGNISRIERWACDSPRGTWKFYRRNGKLKAVEEYGAGGC